MAMSDGEKAGIAVLALAGLGGLAYVALKAQAPKVVATSNSSNMNYQSSAEPILTTGQWSYTETVDPATGQGTLTMSFEGTSTYLSEQGTGTTISIPYPLEDFDVTTNTTNIPTGQILYPGNYSSTGPINVAEEYIDGKSALQGIIIQGGYNEPINGQIVITGTVPSSYMPSSETTKTGQI